MQVHGRLRLARAARRPEPERRLVLVRVGRQRDPARTPRAGRPSSASDRHRAPVGRAAPSSPRRRASPATCSGAMRASSSRRRDEHARARFAEEIPIVRRAEERAARHGDGADLDRAEKRRDELGRVRQHDRHTFLARHAEREQRVAGAVDQIRELAVCDRCADRTRSRPPMPADRASAARR